MGVVIPQVITNRSGAQIIDGSLKFNHSIEEHLERRPGAGNRRTFTWSCWVKLNGEDRNQVIFFAGPDGDDTYPLFWHTDTDNFTVAHYQGGYTYRLVPSALHRDTGWYHIVTAFDTTQSTSSDRIKFYINGEQITDFSTETYPSENYENSINESNVVHKIGFQHTANAFELNGSLSQCYFIDGQQLDASYFGFTDPLTNTWKPKKYVNTTASHGDAAGVVGFGTNGFYLPFDGNSPIGQDQSGQGNDWTPVNFGGSVALDNPQVSGLRPILNVTQGGTQAGVGVFGSNQNVGYAVTVYDDGGGNKYYIDGVKQATLTGLIRGATYTFDTSDSTVSSHPFRFSESDGGSQYTNGVVAITGAATTITIPYNSSNELYYYCTSHSGMGSSITGITTNEKLADQYASHCTLALPLVGANSDVSASIACTTTNKSVTTTGTAAASNDQSNFYNGSFEFDGDSDYLSLADNTDFELGSGDFTLEAYVYQSNAAGTGSNSHVIFSKWNNSGTSKSYALRVTSSSGQKLQFLWSTDGTANNIITSTDYISVNRWHHVAVVNDGGTITLYINGKSQSSTGTAGTLYDSSVGLKIGRTDADSGSQYFDGYIQDVRIYKGVAKYTSDFVVPSTSPDILPDTPSGVSGSSKLTKITDGAVSFDGTGDYLSIADSEDFEFGSGDFTIEAYIYPTGVPQGTYATIFAKGVPLQCYFMNTNSLGLFVDDNNSAGSYFVDNANITGTNSVPQNMWSHIAICRNGNNWKVFVNGDQKYSATHSGTIFNSTSVFSIGDYGASPGTYEFQGFISNFRVVKGTALYTTNFGRPSAPLTNVTNTTLLCCQSNTSATEAAVTPGSITANGDAAATNFNPFNTDINTVRGQETGYATLDPLSSFMGSSSSFSLSNGNLTFLGTGNNDDCASALTTPTTGKYFFEATMDANPYRHVAGWATRAGIDTSAGVSAFTFSNAVGSRGNSTDSDFDIVNQGTVVTTVSGGTGTVMGYGLDLDNQEAKIFRDGILVSTTSITTTFGDTWSPVVGDSSATDASIHVNFGQKPFKFTPPDGFQPLNAANVRPETVIARPDQYVGVTTYTGNDTTQTISELNHKPDLVWLKARTSGGGSYTNHVMVDSVRGKNDSGYRNLYPNLTDSEYDPPNVSSSSVTSLNSNGFDIGGNLNTNYGTATCVAWCWKAGGNENTFNIDNVGYASAAAAGLTGGDITPTGASVGTKQGFSIIKYDGSGTAGDDFPHGLLQTPEFIIVKDTDDSDNWQIYHAGAQTSGAKLLKFTNDGATSNTGPWNNTAPTSTLITLGGGGTNDSDNTHICYAWHSVPGLQKFGSYTGNGDNSTDGGFNGPFIELGFRPSVLLIKRTDTSGNDWVLYDSERSPINEVNKKLKPNSNATELSEHAIDFLSNGFKIRNGLAGNNANNANYIYAAWAEAPSVDLYGGGANAR